MVDRIAPRGGARRRGRGRSARGRASRATSRNPPARGSTACIDRREGRCASGRSSRSAGPPSATVISRRSAPPRRRCAAPPPGRRPGRPSSSRTSHVARASPRRVARPVARRAGEHVDALAHLQRVARRRAERASMSVSRATVGRPAATATSTSARASSRAASSSAMNAPEPCLTSSTSELEPGCELLREDRGDDERDRTPRCRSRRASRTAAGRRARGRRSARRWRSPRAPRRRAGGRCRARCRSRGSPRACRACRPCGPGPRPESIGTAPPQAATIGARSSETLSPTPPVECLSRTGRSRPLQSRTVPLSRMPSVNAGSSVASSPRKKTAIANAATCASVSAPSAMPASRRPAAPRGRRDGAVALARGSAPSRSRCGQQGVEQRARADPEALGRDGVVAEDRARRRACSRRPARPCARRRTPSRRRRRSRAPPQRARAPRRGRRRGRTCRSTSSGRTRPTSSAASAIARIVSGSGCEPVSRMTFSVRSPHASAVMATSRASDSSSPWSTERHGATTSTSSTPSATAWRRWRRRRPGRRRRRGSSTTVATLHGRVLQLLDGDGGEAGAGCRRRRPGRAASAPSRTARGRWSGVSSSSRVVRSSTRDGIDHARPSTNDEAGARGRSRPGRRRRACPRG